MDDDIREEREEVQEEIEENPETPDEAAEQRTDDYDGLARRLDEIMEMVRDGFDSVRASLEALGVTQLESASVAGNDVEEIVDAGIDTVGDLMGLDTLDLL